MSRSDWDTYYIGLAVQAATRATCPRLRVGSILVRDRRVISTGYNGSVTSAPHCDDVGCLIEDNHCQACVHAEQNAIASAAKSGVSTDFSVIYITHNPCIICYKLMVNSGIKRIVYKDVYKEVNYGKLMMSDNCKPSISKLS